jgi:hypothetical protein
MAETTPHLIYNTREEYLGAFISTFRQNLAGLGFTLPEAVRVSCGWPAKGGLSQSRKKLYDVWPFETSKDGFIEIFISPLLSQPLDVLTTLTAALGPACVGLNDKEGLKRYFKVVGLTGKPAEPAPSDELKHFLEARIEESGAFPGGAIDPAKILKDEADKKPGSRMLKAQCEAPDCGYVIRLAAKWLDRGLPVCVCGMKFIGPDRDADGEIINEG